MFGPAAVVYCCALMFVVPAVYLSVIANFRGQLRQGTLALLNMGLAFGFVGYLFGDVLGILAAILVALPSYSVSYVSPRQMGKRVRGINFGGVNMDGMMRDFFDGEVPPDVAKRKNDDFTIDQ